MVAASPVSSVLTDELLERCGERAAVYDRENRLFVEDFAELRRAGYLLAAVPSELGRLGLSLAEATGVGRVSSFVAGMGSDAKKGVRTWR